MTFVSLVAENVDGITQDASLEGILLENRREGPRPRPDWFYLKDLVNPQQAYWEHLGEAPEYTEEQLDRFSYGNYMHGDAEQAFSLVDGFAGIESKLDGAEIGLSGIRGKVDFRFNTSLVEFKTSQYNMETGADVWESAPQDIEQLLFYAVLWSYEVPTHYLVYHLGDGPESVRAFRVTIENRGLLENTLRQRRDALQQALDDQDPAFLHQCRFFDDACHIQDAGLCSCDELDKWNVEPLQRETELRRDDELEGVLVTAFEEIQDRPEPVKPWDLETPRRWYGRQTGERERGPWTPPDSWVYDALASADLLPGPLEDVFIPRIRTPLDFYAPGLMVKRTQTTGDGTEDRWVPTLHRVKDYEERPDPMQLRNQVMQVGCMCALSGKQIGQLIVELPQAEAEVVVYRISFVNLEEVKEEIRNRLGLKQTALQENNPENLPSCPEWLQERDCENCLCR